MSWSFAGRMNSFILKGTDLFEAISVYREIPDMTHMELNYPEHLAGRDLDEVKEAFGPLKLNGLAVRWRKGFLGGNFTNPDNDRRAEAIAMTKEACDVCRKLGGSVITLWFENDGFDYAFQKDYGTAWDLLVEGLREVGDYAPDLKISVEYKPYEERNFAMVDSAGMTMYLIQEVDRPNVGCTLDFCHMLMKKDNPSFGLALAAKKGKLFGLHMNDGYGHQDSGMIFGSINHALTAEFVYYLKKVGYDGVVFFDTFPIREEAGAEIRANIEAFLRYSAIIDDIGLDAIQDVISKQDGIAAQQLVLGMLR